MKPRLVLSWRDVGVVGAKSLAPAEAALLSAAARPKRRAEFAAGRAAARAAVAQMSGVPRDEIVILREDGEASGRPYAATGDGHRLDLALSITHAAGIAIAATADVPLGVDVVAYEPMAPAFLEDAFTPEELAGWRARYHDETVAACTAFAAKEAALKWLGCGMRVPLRSVCVVPDADSASHVTVHVDGRATRLAAYYGELERRVWVALVTVAVAGVPAERRRLRRSPVRS